MFELPGILNQLYEEVATGYTTASFCPQDLSVFNRPFITINPIAGDDVVDQTEQQSAVTISGTFTGLSGGTSGQTIEVLVDGITYTSTVASDAWSVTVPQADVAKWEASEVVTARWQSDNNFAVDKTISVPIELALWLDGNDSSTITESGGVVSQWNDKSSNANHFVQTISGKRPLVIAGTGGNVIKFDGVDDFLIQQSLRSLTNFSVFIVWEQSTLQPGQRLIDARGTGAAGSVKGWSLKNYSTGTSVDIGIVDEGNGNAQNSRGPYTPAFNTNISCFLFDSGGTSQVYINENFVNTLFNVGTGVVNTCLNSLNICLGTNANGQNTQFLNGSIGDVLIFNQPANTSQRNTIAGYLAHKRGLSANLPSGHPYKTVAPTWNPSQPLT